MYTIYNIYNTYIYTYTYTYNIFIRLWGAFRAVVLCVFSCALFVTDIPEDCLNFSTCTRVHAYCVKKRDLQVSEF